MLLTAPTPAIPRKSSLRRIVEQSTILLMVCIGTLIFILALLILFHQNANATKGYQLRKFERERSQLMLEEEVLNSRIAQEQSLENLENDPRIQAMVPTKKPVYMQSEDAVAENGVMVSPSNP